MQLLIVLPVQKVNREKILMKKENYLSVLAEPSAILLGIDTEYLIIKTFHSNYRFLSMNFPD